MERQKLSAIAHRRHPIACPLGDGKVDTLLGELEPCRGASALDIGCGQGEWLFRLLSRYPEMQATGIDQSSVALESARKRTAAAASRIRLEQADAVDYVAACSEKFDVVLCTGSTHALGGYRETLATTRKLLNERGCLLVADGYWEQSPTEAALAALDAEFDDFRSLNETIQAAVDAGYTPHYAAVSSQDEWDHYEWSWCGSLERYAAETPSDEDAKQALETARAHRTGYLTGYRGILGFVALVLHPAGR